VTTSRDEVLQPDEWAAFAAAGRVRSFRRAQVLFRERDPGGSVFALRSGRVRVVVAARAGRELTLAEKGPGELLGELSAIDGRPRSATAVALEATETVVISAEQFNRLLDAHPRLAVRLLRVLVAQVRATDRDLSDREGATLLARVALRLQLLSQRAAEHGRGRAGATLWLTQEDLAAWVGASREATSRALQRLRDASIVTTGRGTITVLSPEGLAEIVGDRG